MKKSKMKKPTGKSHANLDFANIKPKIDNKPPAFSIDVYYKTRDLESDAQTVVKIDTENFELLKKLNTIHRTGGVVDCWNREFNYTSPLSELPPEGNIAQENREMLKTIEQAKGLYSTAELMREWKKSKAAKEASKKAPTKPSKVLNTKVSKLSDRSDKIVASGVIDDFARPRCYFEIEIESNHRNLGKLIFQLFSDIVPRTCENFQSFCTGFNGLSYVGTPFHRIVPGYRCQGGDVTKFNGSGGTSIFGDTFEDENFELKHCERGILSTCNFEKNSNNSMFNLSFKRLETMDGKCVVFGKVVGGFSTLKELERYGTMNGKPIMKIVVTKCGIF